MNWENAGCSARLCSLAVAALVCTGLGAAAHGQSFSCPQVVLSENHSCVVGSCKGQYSVNLCDTTDLTSSYQCVYKTPTCCGKPQVAFQSATEGGDCVGCSGQLREPLLPSPNAATKEKPTESGATQGKQGRKPNSFDGIEAVRKEAKS